MVIELLFAVLLALLISLVLNRLMLVLAPRLGLMDEPGEDRRIHSTAIPRAGGIAIWLTFLLVTFGVLASRWFQDFGQLSWTWLGAFAAGSSVLMIAGFVDDKVGLRAVVKLGAHILAPAVFLLIHPIRTGLFPIGWNVPPILDGCVFVAWVVLLINAFNLIDGLDGLCGGLAAVSSLALAGFAMANERMDSALLLLIMGGAILGFLRYNFNPARIFLGDAGSMLMGFFLATAATDAVGRKAVVGIILLPIAVAGVPLLDVLLAIWRRGARRLVRQMQGEASPGGIFEPDREHLHHRLLDSGDSQRKVAAILQGIAIVLALLAFLPMMFGPKVFSISLVGFLVVGLMAIRHLARVEIEHTGSVIHMAIKLPGHRRRVAAVLFLYDLLVLSLAAAGAVMLETSFLTTGGGMVELIRFVLVFTIFGCLCLLTVQVHHRIWVRATMRDVLSLQFWLLIAAVGTFSFFSLIYSDLAWSPLRLSVMSFVFACGGVCLPRVTLDLLREAGFDARHLKLAKGRDATGCPVVVLGAGDLGTLLLDHLKSSASDIYPGIRVLGFVDESRVLRGRRLRSFRILGDLSIIPDLAEKGGLKGIIVAIQHPRQETVDLLDEYAEKYDLRIFRWKVALQEET
jgi:UDP-GlcNAc:undecaprenyl-phosphate GlcNAc-1-phosphate transferase